MSSTWRFPNSLDVHLDLLNFDFFRAIIMTSEKADQRPAPGKTQTKAAGSRPQRVLSCILCQQRKVKCDRRFPCANCTRAGVECIAPSATRPQRKRRFPERMLLDRLRHYESLLRQNNIDFTPLHPSDSTVDPNTPSSSETGASPENSERPAVRILDKNRVPHVTETVYELFAFLPCTIIKSDHCFYSDIWQAISRVV